MEQTDLLRYAVGVLEELGIPYLVAGSFASGAYGEPRLTLDIDIVIDPSPEQVTSLCSAFPLPDYYVSEEAARRALDMRRQFNVLHPTSGQKIDFMIAEESDWGRSQLLRKRRTRLLPDREAYVGAPEDTIISKMRYYRQSEQEKHLRDIAGIVRVSGEKLDRAYIARWAEEYYLTDIWHTILKRLGEPIGD